jgi:hypothetical protein
MFPGGIPPQLLQQVQQQQQQQQQGQHGQGQQGPIQIPGLPPQTGQQQQGQQQQQQLQQPQLPAGMSAQFLDAMAKNSALTEQQKRYIEEARRQSLSMAQPGQGQGQGQGQYPGDQQQQPMIQAPQLPQMPGQPSQLQSQHQLQQAQQGLDQQGGSQPSLTPNQQGTPQQTILAQQAAMTQSAMQGMKANPSLAYAWMKSKEDNMRSKFREWLALLATCSMREISLTLASARSHSIRPGCGRRSATPTHRATTAGSGCARGAGEDAKVPSRRCGQGARGVPRRHVAHLSGKSPVTPLP